MLNLVSWDTIDYSKSIGMKFLLLSSNKKTISYQYIKDHNQESKMTNNIILWKITKFPHEKTKWQAKMYSQDNKYYELFNDNQNFIFKIKEIYPECIDWLLFNMNWLE
jgi:hypothetical protein